MSSQPPYTGRMTRDAEGNVSGYLIDDWGWRITFTATKDGDGYALTGVLGDVPDSLRLEVLDGAKSG